MKTKQTGKKSSSKQRASSATIGSKFRTRWRHLQKIDEMIRGNKAPTCADIAGELEVCRRTVLRDIEFFRYEFGAPVEYDPIKGGYVYTEPNWAMPNIRITEGDLFAIMVAEKALDAYAGTPWQSRLKDVYEKIIASLPDRISISPDDMLPRISFDMNARARISPEIMVTIGKAISENRVLEISYKKLGAKDARNFVINPYVIHRAGGAWYLVGKDHRSGHIPMFNICRIKTAKLQKSEFDYIDSDFDPKKYFANTFSSYENQQTLDVTIEFSGTAAELVMERHWHESQKMQELPGGKVRMEIVVSHLNDIWPWVMSWGSEAKVIKPRALKDLVTAEAKKIVKEPVAQTLQPTVG